MFIRNLIGHTINRTPQSQPNRDVEFSLESLEDRQMMAGNVIAYSNGAGDLIVQGDGAANHIYIEKNVPSHAILKAGLGTTINGSIDGKVVLWFGADGAGYVERDIVIKMGDGDDLVEVKDLDIHGKIRMDMGNGNDKATMERVDGGGYEFSFVMGSGDDVLALHDVAVKKATIRTDSGNDLISTKDLHTLSAGVDVNTGSGDDVALFSGNVGKFKLKMADGNDLAMLGLDIFEVGKIRIKMGDGTDHLQLVHTDVTSSTKIAMGGGEDDLAVNSSAFFFDKFKANGGGGNDRTWFDSPHYSKTPVYQSFGDGPISTADLLAMVLQAVTAADDANIPWTWVA